MYSVGVLALQGDFLEHIQMLQHIGAKAREIRLPQELKEVQALILPGGESTTMVRLLDLHGFRERLCQRIQEGMPVWGTCAGLIILARQLQEKNPTPLGLMDVLVTRNAYGRQMNSFEAKVSFPALGVEPIQAIFIRAPAIIESGTEVEILARLSDGTPVAVRQDNILATAFHPELTLDMRMHAYFLDMVEFYNRELVDR
jgi:5'-phosphate synthase pdxT subunit